MAQLTIRTSEELLDRIRTAAASRGGSMNDFVTRVLDVATDPDLNTDETDRVRERLAHAGLLVTHKAPRCRPAGQAVAAARAAAGAGRPMSDLIGDGRS